jgi:hypothetical protein
MLAAIIIAVIYLDGKPGRSVNMSSTTQGFGKVWSNACERSALTYSHMQAKLWGEEMTASHIKNQYYAKIAPSLSTS